MSPGFSIAPPNVARRIGDEVELRERIGMSEIALGGREDRAGVARRRTRPSAARPFGATIEIGVWLRPARPASRTSNSPTANATRYDGSGGVRWNTSPRVAGAGRRARSPRACSRTRAWRRAPSASGATAPCGPARRSRGTRAARPCGSNCVTAYQRPASCCRKSPTRALAVEGAGVARSTTAPRPRAAPSRTAGRRRPRCPATSVAAALVRRRGEGHARALAPIASFFALSQTRSVGSSTRTVMSMVPLKVLAGGIDVELRLVAQRHDVARQAQARHGGRRGLRVRAALRRRASHSSERPRKPRKRERQRQESVAQRRSRRMLRSKKDAGRERPGTGLTILPINGPRRKPRAAVTARGPRAPDTLGGRSPLARRHARSRRHLHARRRPRRRAGVRLADAAARPVDARRLHAGRHPGGSVHPGLRRRPAARLADGGDRRDPADVRRRHALPSAGAAARVARRRAGRDRAERGRDASPAGRAPAGSAGATRRASCSAWRSRSRAPWC